jgi:tetraacyldisaccharide-1-P 4'-kinase
MGFERQDYDKLIGDEPVLMAEAHGMAKIRVYHGDIRKLERKAGKADICLIDPFPSVDPAEYLTLSRDFAEKVVVI